MRGAFAGRLCRRADWCKQIRGGTGPIRARNEPDDLALCPSPQPRAGQSGRREGWTTQWLAVQSAANHAIGGLNQRSGRTADAVRAEYGGLPPPALRPSPIAASSRYWRMDTSAAGTDAKTRITRLKRRYSAAHAA